MRRIIIYFSLFLCFFTSISKGQSHPDELKIAFLADVHFQDLYGTAQNSDFKGIINPKNRKIYSFANNGIPVALYPDF